MAEEEPPQELYVAISHLSDSDVQIVEVSQYLGEAEQATHGEYGADAVYVYEFREKRDRF